MIRIFTISLLLCLPILSQAQDFYDLNSVKDIKITFAEDNWDTILDSLKYIGTKQRLKGKVQVNGTTYNNVGIRYKGNSSYHNTRKLDSSKLPFNIKLNFENKTQTLKGGYKTIKLSNVFRDPSFVREALAYEIARKYMPAPKANFARLYVNGEYLGLYSSVESIDTRFIEENFGNGDGLLYKCDPDNFGKTGTGKGCKRGNYANLQFIGQDSACYQNLYEIKSDYGWKQLIDLTKALSADEVKGINKLVNVDQVLWMHAFNDVLVNLDSYSGRLCHNYYMYYDTSGVFHPLVWDMNLAFGGFRYDGEGEGLTNKKMQELTPFLHYKNEKRPLISKILANSLFRKIYVAHVKTILKENFSNGDYKKRAEAMQRTIDHYVKSDENKLYTYEAFKANATSTAEAGKAKIIGISELMDARASYLSSHPLMQKAQPRISDVKHTKESENINFTARVADAEKVFLAVKTGKSGAFQIKRMQDNGEGADTTKGDGVFGISLPKQANMQYYIIAEGEKTAQLSPENASFEFYEVK